MNERRVQDFLYAKYGEERIRTVVVQGRADVAKDSGAKGKKRSYEWERRRTGSWSRGDDSTRRSVAPPPTRGQVRPELYYIGSRVSPDGWETINHPYRAREFEGAQKLLTTTYGQTCSVYEPSQYREKPYTANSPPNRWKRKETGPERLTHNNNKTKKTA